MERLERIELVFCVLFLFVSSSYSIASTQLKSSQPSKSLLIPPNFTVDSLKPIKEFDSSWKLGEKSPSGGGGVDKFRIKIQQNNEGVIYVNKFGTFDDIDNADPQELGGGSIVIHKK
jgi:hypothetical protein